jgi:hypothetical protein
MSNLPNLSLVAFETFKHHQRQFWARRQRRATLQLRAAHVWADMHALTLPISNAVSREAFDYATDLAGASTISPKPCLRHKYLVFFSFTAKI